ncbi:MAG: hypothetical protein J0L91_11105 [Burkholderiales bacterium]|nr:hypothetical protein [Burkholderiales bacterium]
MTKLFTTFRRAALLACALGYGIAAHAASVTVDAGAACTAFSWNPANSTLSCQVSTDCVVTGANSAVVNTNVTLTASCPTSETITWDGAGTSGCSGATCDVTNAATGNQTYGATGNSSARGTKVVNWTSNSVAPSQCTLTASPSSGTAASNVTLTADCSSGTDPITIAWTGSGSGSCPTTFNVSGSAATCTINNVAATTTWTAAFSNSAGSFANNPRSATFTYNAGGGGGADFANCPVGTITVTGQWGNTGLWTSNFGAWGSDQIISFQLIPNAATVVRNFNWNEYSGGSTVRDYSLSTVACDFSSTNAVNGSYGGKVVGSANNPQGYYKAGTTVGGSTTLAIGTKYYWNMRIPANACPSGDCGMIGGFPK